MQLRETSKNQKEVNIGVAIRKGLLKKGLPQKELASLLGVSPALVSGWVTGTKIPTGDDLIRIMEILDIVPLLFPKYQCQADKANEEDELPPLILKELAKIWEAIADLQIKLAKRESTPKEVST
jgi:transcriptional regulator with XRE-family HTH domain